MSQDVAFTRPYELKKPEYFKVARKEMLPFIPPTAKRILEAGCGEGVFGALVKSLAEVEYWGVEPSNAAYEVAKTRLDQSMCQPFSSALQIPKHYFDCVVFNDVLEHLIDPEEAIKYAGMLLVQGGAIVASIPNIRHFPTAWKLIVNQDWKYQDEGILDRTHLRFFTRKSIIRMFEESGFDVQKIVGINAFAVNDVSENKLWRYFKVLNVVAPSVVHDMKFLQFAVVAKNHPEK